MSHFVDLNTCAEQMKVSLSHNVVTKQSQK